ncbi:Monoacylglycerol lipase abhd12 [Podila epigama]|nr:Monoacylglycerol lipase abhd12 [Podila epigama]
MKLTFVYPPARTFIAFTTRTIYISTPDGLRLGAWHILPLDTPRTVLEKIHAKSVTHNSTNNTTTTTTTTTTATITRENDDAADSVFESALASADKVVLYFHGQASDRGKANRVAAYHGIQKAMPSAHVVTIDCRGYGDSEGFPSEAGFKVDALAAWSWITKRVEADKVLIYGHSLGSGIATNLCLQLEEEQIQPLALVLDAAFTSMPDMMTGYRRVPIVWPFAHFPVLLNHFKVRLLDRFETVRAVETMRSPLLLIHGQEDADVLITNSHTLFHTALTARRLQSCTKELAVTEAGEAASAEEELARAGLELTFQYSRSSETGPESEMTRLSQEGDHDDEPSTQPHTSHRSRKHHRRLHDHEHNHVQSQCSTIQMEFPREGSLEYNEEYQIGFLTVQYAVHNTCIDFEITKEALCAFVETIETRLRKRRHRRHSQEHATVTSTTAVKTGPGSEVHSSSAKHGHGHGRGHGHGLAHILRQRKVGLVDQSEVPEVVE